MKQSATAKTSKAIRPKPVFSFPKLAKFEKSNNGGLRVALTSSPRLLKYEQKEMINQAKTCAYWAKGLGLSASDLGLIDDHGVSGVVR